MLNPLQRMWARVDNSRQDSDSALFLELMYLGEMLAKTAVAAMVAAIRDDTNRHRYQLLHRLVRADGLGEWQECLSEVLTGPSLQHLVPDALECQRDLTQRMGRGCWQYAATELIHECLTAVDAANDDLPAKVDLRRWFVGFVQLRNKTRGHGAPSATTCSLMVPALEKSLRLMTEHLGAFKQPWAYLHRNLSGKYRVVGLTDSASEFDALKSDKTSNLRDGVYVHFGVPLRVDLITSDADILDFYYANGGFTGRKYESLSYVTGTTKIDDGTPYMAPTTELPASTTHGIGKLEVEGQCFTNIPQQPAEYIRRPELEDELRNTLLNDRHPVITLVGRGGIGKTSLALKVLHEITANERFIGILWFSARDVDLLAEGPKIVRPNVLTKEDIARDLVGMFRPSTMVEKAFRPVDFLGNTLTRSSVGPLLFVFDNFETVQNPAELFSWLDTYIRLPNKILITTRHREFKGDYSVEVGGMTEQQSDDLIDATAGNLGIQYLLTEDHKREIYRESDGHPYVVKILVGESAKAGAVKQVERIVASKDEILHALFERTYARLSPASRRVFLTLSSWRSVVPQIALEATLLRPENEKMDVAAAIEELRRFSFLDTLYSPVEGAGFLSVPLTASVFGARKPLSPLIVHRLNRTAATFISLGRSNQLT